MSDKLATDVVDWKWVDLKFRTSKDRILIDAKDPVFIWVDGRYLPSRVRFLLVQ